MLMYCTPLYIIVQCFTVYSVNSAALDSFGQSEACLDPGAGIFLTPLASATLSYTLGMVWNDQTSRADAKRPANKTL